MTDQPGDWHRLHPLSPLVRSGRAAAGVLAIVAISASGQFGPDGSHLYDWAVAVLVVIGAVVNWLVTRWKLDGPTLRIETGLLRRDSRQLPVARIQAVDVVRPFLARALGLAELRVRLAGSSHADGRLAYLPEQAALDLRARLLAAHHGLDPATPEPGERILASVPNGRLVGS
ncbi:MAG TPA: PH domain-containing protein, partial [Streptosporangiaceae bacterium]